MSLNPGVRLGSYEILAAVGAGGMGEVYRARDTQLGREVAVKVLPELFSQDKDRLVRFEREARSLALLNHPNIATIHEVGESAGTRFLVMELVPGETLGERIARGPLSVAEALSVFRQIAAALEAAHGKGIVHRDLKPSNVKVTEEGLVKVLDFGLAKALGDEQSGSDLSQSPTMPRGTATGVILGTAPYMSPEQARGKTTDQRADIWAFGCCLYEVLAGRAAFLGETITDTLARILEREPDWNVLPEAMPSNVRSLLRRCLRKEPHRRLQHMGDARIEIEDLLTELSTPEPMDAGTRSTTATRWFHWLPALIGVAFFLAALWILGRAGSMNPEVKTEVRQQQITANPIENPILSAAISPDGKYVAYADLSGLFLRLTETGESHEVSLPDGFQVMEVDWYSEGTNLLFRAVADGANSLWKIPILGGNPRKLRNGVMRAVGSPDGSSIAFLEGAPAREIHVMGPNGENVRRVVAGGEGDSFWELAWSPDGERLAYGRWNVGPEGMRNTIESIHLESGRMSVSLSDIRLFQDWRGALPFCWTPDGRLVYALRELPPNQKSSNLWVKTIDLDSGETSGTPSRITQAAGYNFKDLSMTADGNRLTYLLERNQGDVYVGELGDDGAHLGNVRRLTLDDRNDWPRAWMPNSREILFDSNRGGSWSLLKQDREEWTAEAVAVIGDIEGNGALSPDGAWILHWASNDLMRLPVSGGPSEQVLTAPWGDEEVYFRAFRCGRAPESGCILGERDEAQTQYVFTSFEPLAGRGEELVRVEDKPPFTFWDLSPDGTRVALVHNENSIRLIELPGGAEAELSRDGWILGESVAWSADGESLFIDGGPLESTVYKKALLNVTLDGEVHVLRQKANEWHIFPVPSPDGRFLAFGVVVFSGNVMMLEGF